MVECWFDDETNDAIHAEVRADVDRLPRRDEVFAGRYIDFTAFDNIAPFVDWRAPPIWGCLLDSRWTCL